jgi:hypothetical protein
MEKLRAATFDPTEIFRFATSDPRASDPREALWTYPWLAEAFPAEGFLSGDRSPVGQVVAIYPSSVSRRPNVFPFRD